MVMSDFVLKYYPIAKQVEKKYHINAIAILAQAALESANGTSKSATNRKNFFGITASGKPNQYWDGSKSQSSVSGLWFRIYRTPKDSFMDFGRLISSKYPECAKKSFSVNEYAKCIAQSAYITDKFDDRNGYERILKQKAKEFEPIIEEIERKKRKKIISIILISVILVLAISLIIYKVRKK